LPAEKPLSINHKNQNGSQSVSISFEISEIRKKNYFFFTGYLISVLFTVIGFTCGKVM